MSEYIGIKKRIRIWYERIFVAENIRIYLNIRIFNTLWYEKYDTNEYPNIFGSKKWYERIYEYIRIKKRIRIWYERIFVADNIWIYSNMQIFVTLCSHPFVSRSGLLSLTFLAMIAPWSPRSPGWVRRSPWTLLIHRCQEVWSDQKREMQIQKKIHIL